MNVVADELRLALLQLLESTGVLPLLKALRQLLVRLSDFVASVGVGAIFAVMALLGLLVVLAQLCLDVVVGDVHHLVLQLHW